ncbi:diaminohydroxyphosphoribosylaminopyrimidine deaminase [bacterium A37T11]|nr:diaminohydroxyphosphoribosylaminopyrimidine deaminase [bacterium A37T11]
MDGHEIYMRRCLDLAALGTGLVSPNPMVGAVVVYNNRIIGEGWHQAFGGPHAEVHAINEVMDKFSNYAEIFKNSTLYVNLEPCAHYGKTPPCARLIAEHQLKRVVIGCRDPFDAVNGKGIALLQDARVEVIEGVLQKESEFLNRRFITRVRQHRPYVILKWAQTADGYFAPDDGSQQWISSPQAQQMVHRWRSEEDAVLVGKNTALIDNPRLNVRAWNGRNPLRIVIDKNLEVPSTHHLLDGSIHTLVFNALKSDWSENLKYISLENFDLYLPQQILYQLYLMDVQSVIVEGGLHTLKAFTDAGLWDEARIFKAPLTWGKGKLAINLKESNSVNQKVGIDNLTIYYKSK